MDQNVTDNPPKRVDSRFELAASRMADAWVRAGRITISRDDLRTARDFFERGGWIVEETGDGLLRVSRRRGRRIRELTPEALVLDAFRRLARR